MGKYLFVYYGGKMAATPAEQKKIDGCLDGMVW